MVYIHGGGYEAGAPITFPSDNLALQGFVAVHNEPDVLSNQYKIWDPAEIVEFYSTISAGSRHSNFMKRHLVIVPGQVGVSSRRR